MRDIQKLIFALIILRPLMDILVAVDINFMGITINIAQIWGIAFIFISLSYIFLHKINIVKTKMHRSLLFLFIISLFPLFFYSESISYGFIKLSKWAVWILGFSVFYDLFRDKENVHKFSTIITNMVWFVILLYYLSFFISRYLGYNIFLESELAGYSYTKYKLGFKGIFYGAHSLSFLAIFLIILIFIKCYFLDLHFTRTSMIQIVLLMIIVFSVLVRTGILCLLVLLFFLFKENRKYAFIMALAILLFAKYYNAEDIVQRRLLREYYRAQSTGTQLDTNALGSGRVGMARAVLRYYSEQNLLKKLLGSGFDADLVATETYFVRRGSHNDFLDFLLNTGLVSLIIYLAFLVRLIRTINYYSRKLDKKRKNFIYGIYGSMLILMIFQGISMTIHMFYFILMNVFLVWSLYYFQNGNIKNNEEKIIPAIF